MDGRSTYGGARSLVSPTSSSSGSTSGGGTSAAGSSRIDASPAFAGSVSSYSRPTSKGLTPGQEFMGSFMAK
jgi:hypothetical protein